MTTIKKIWISVTTIIGVMLVLPTVAWNLHIDDCGMGLSILLFFLVNPLTVLALGILAGTDLRHLWWIPIVASAVFPPLFWVAILDVVFDLYFYSALYVGVGVLAMLGSYLGIRFAKK